jgi:phosphosulfolactate synthase (CoM biosynthesis protein A)
VELGPHHPDEPFAVDHIIKQCHDFLKAGAWKIVLEGEVINLMKPWENLAAAEKVLRIGDSVGADNLVFEVGGNLTLVRWFVLQFGPDCSFGNIGRDRVMQIEHIRRGLNYPETWIGKFASL